MFCARSRPTNKGNKEQKPITKKLAEFHNQFVLLTMLRLSTNQQLATNHANPKIKNLAVSCTVARESHLYESFALKLLVDRLGWFPNFVFCV